MSCMRSLRSRAASVVFCYRHGECRDILSAKDVVKGPPPKPAFYGRVDHLGRGLSHRSSVIVQKSSERYPCRRKAEYDTLSVVLCSC